MKNPDWKTLAKNKYLLLALALGLALLLLPRRSADTSAAAPAATAPAAAGDPLDASGIPLDTESGRLAALLANIGGVGAAEVLLSARGCVVVCEGADRADVRLSVTNAVAAYTGLGSDRIEILKMTISGGNAK